MLKVRTFHISDDDPRAGEEAIANFLAHVHVDRIETAYADGGWRTLIIYNDPRQAEEAEQIASVIAANLRGWRDGPASGFGGDGAVVLSDDLIGQIAQYVPTTALELRVILNSGNVHEAVHRHQDDIVQVVRQTLDDLS